MDYQEIREWLEALQKEENDPTASLVETHGAWIILHGSFAYKIKKPVNLGFLDFSTLEKRAFTCFEEVRLNSRLTNIYHGVLAIFKEGELWYTCDAKHTGDRKPYEYAVQMDRIDPSLEMHIMLAAGKVTRRHVRELARQLADFHKRVDIAAQKPEAVDLKKDFDDVLCVQQLLKTILGENFAEKLDQMVAAAALLLAHTRQRIPERNRQGWVRDVHGDVHAGNIFLTDPPIIFDCIEFNKHFREVDVLSEIAFLCMDLERFGYPDLSASFLAAYLEDIDALSTPEDKALFLFYKLYRLNIRIKVKTIQAGQHVGDTEIIKKFRVEMSDYFDLLDVYLAEADQVVSDSMV